MLNFKAHPLTVGKLGHRTLTTKAYNNGDLPKEAYIGAFMGLTLIFWIEEAGNREAYNTEV
eukprot:1156094-Pelagomonas_calceolata.AAC.7